MSQLCNELLDRALAKARLAERANKNTNLRKDSFSSDELALIEREWRAGKSISEIAHKVPRSRSTVGKVVKRLREK